MTTLYQPKIATNAADIEELLHYLTDEERAELDQLLASQRLSFEDWLKTVSPEWNWNYKHLRYIRRQLQRITDKELRRLMLFVPPQHGKTEQTTVRYAAWRLEQDPTLRIVIAAYSQDYATLLSRKVRRIAAQRIPLARDRKAMDEWETEAGGGLKAVGVGAGVTGRAADLLIIDDPVKSREEADSLAYRNRVYEWYTNDLITRRSNRFAIILIQTRWHEDDLAGRILNSSDSHRWEVVSLPALAEQNDPLGRAEGEALCPELHDQEEILQTKDIQGERHFTALYQQKPRPDEGSIFKRQWLSNFVTETPANTRWVRFWDLATSTKTTADFTAGALVGADNDGNIYIAGMEHGRWEWPDAKRKIIETAQADGIAVTVGIEDVAFQLAAVQDLRRSKELFQFRIKQVHPDRDKLSRALLWADKAESGKLFLIKGEWTDGFIEECLSFGSGSKHDDRVDAVSGAMKLVRNPMTIIA